jgi:hypothetical protein
MENYEQLREVASSTPLPALKFEDQLKQVIASHLERLSQDGKEKVLEYINVLIDLEQKRREFNRRQGLLYNWAHEESQD